MSVRNTISVISAFAFMAVMLTAAGGARAESEGPYVHGQLRVHDKEVFFCFDPYRDKAIDLAELYNAYVLYGKNKDGPEYKLFRALRDQALDEHKCFYATEISHNSLLTIYEAPKGLPVGERRNVVLSRRERSSKNFYFYVLTGEEVPPLEFNCIRPNRIGCTGRGFAPFLKLPQSP